MTSEENTKGCTGVVSAIESFLKRPIVIIAIIGLVIRFVLAPFISYPYDVYHWGLIVENYESGNGLYGLAGYYYTPVWGYILNGLATFSEVFLDISVIGERVLEALPVENYTDWFLTGTLTSLSFNMLIKVTFFISDLVVGYLIYWLVKDIGGSENKATVAFALWFLCPFVIVVGACGIMFDTISVMMSLLCIILLRRNYYLLAGVTFGLAALTKMFPAFMIFALIAYVLCKNKEDGTGLKKLTMAIVGATVTMCVILAPQILDGTLPDCFTFITARATSGLGAEFSTITRYGIVLAYIGILTVSILLARPLMRCDTETLDRKFLWTVLSTFGVVFLYPSTPQYILLMVPLLTIYIVLENRRLLKPWIILSVGTTMFALSMNFINLLPFAAYTDLLSIDALMPFVDAFQQKYYGISGTSILYYTGAVLQWIGTALLVWMLYNDIWRGKHTFAKPGDVIADN